MKTLKSQNKSFSQEIYTWYSLFGKSVIYMLKIDYQMSQLENANLIDFNDLEIVEEILGAGKLILHSFL